MKRIDKNTIEYGWKLIEKWCAIIFAILTTILSFVSLDDICKLTPCLKILLITVVVLAISIVCIVFTIYQKERVFWRRGNNSITIQVGDIFHLSNYERNAARKLIIIPVNTNFDTIVEQPDSSPHPLVSANTLHGRWINSILCNEHNTSTNLESAIFSYLDAKNVSYRSSNRERGSNREYETGTCAIYSHGNIDYVLLALSQFDENNNAHCTKEDLINAIKGLLSFLDQNGQGYDAYVPVMGTGRSRAGLRHDEALKIIARTMLLYSERITSNIHIVIYSGDAGKVSIYDV